ncbi:MAG: glycerol-3-phosphate acyltransferase [Dehalococcoidales bacterium]|nr:glycerol-3-phosphate acyltransferase [Dehalococcoidales bacterium]
MITINPLYIDNNIWLALITALAYLIGSFPTAYFITKRMLGKDIRFEGSGNVGSMNTYSLIKSTRSGKQAILGLGITMLTDLGKGVLAIHVARWLALTEYNLAAALIIASTFVILGHNYLFCFRFKQGGRGIAPLMGILIALNAPSIMVWGGALLLSIFVAQRILIGKISRESFSDVFSVIGNQVIGRISGLAIALLPLYFFYRGLFFPVLAATVLILIKHADIIKKLVKESKRTQAQNQ